MSPVARRLTLMTLHLLPAALVAWLLLDGLEYYLAPLIDRPRHELFWQLKPGGSRGHFLGWAGSLMMVVLLGYSLRKRWSRLRRWGAISAWLDVHIFLGLWGPMLVVLHSSFKVGGLVSISFWSMIAVAASGVFGRFLYVQIPRSRSGDELSLEEANRLDHELGRELVEEAGVDPERLQEMEVALLSGVRPQRFLPLLMLDLALAPLLLRWRLPRIERRSGVAVSPRQRRILRRKFTLRRRILLWQRLGQLFHYWHVFHKPFAVLMYVFMVVHVGVAWMTGYGPKWL